MNFSRSLSLFVFLVVCNLCTHIHIHSANVFSVVQACDLEYVNTGYSHGIEPSAGGFLVMGKGDTPAKAVYLMKYSDSG